MKAGDSVRLSIVEFVEIEIAIVAPEIELIPSGKIQIFPPLFTIFIACLIVIKSAVKFFFGITFNKLKTNNL